MHNMCVEACACVLINLIVTFPVRLHIDSHICRDNNIFNTSTAKDGDLRLSAPNVVAPCG